MSTFKLLFLLGSFCLTMWQLPQIIGAVDGAKSGSLTKMLQLIGSGPSTAAAAGTEQDSQRINELLGQLGVPEVGAGQQAEQSDGEPVLITPGDGSVTPEEARARIAQQRREALERAGRPVEPEKDAG